MLICSTGITAKLLVDFGVPFPFHGRGLRPRDTPPKWLLAVTMLDVTQKKRMEMNESSVFYFAISENHRCELVVSIFFIRDCW